MLAILLTLINIQVAVFGQECCAVKTVGNYSYTLQHKLNSTHEYYKYIPSECLNACVYQRDDLPPRSYFCFKRGKLEVSGCKMGVNEAYYSAFKIYNNLPFPIQGHANFEACANFQFKNVRPGTWSPSHSRGGCLLSGIYVNEYNGPRVCTPYSGGGTGEGEFEATPSSGGCKVIHKHGCFSGDSQVETENGLKKIPDLKIGDKVLTARFKQPFFTEFIGWIERHSNKSVDMLRIKTFDGSAITLTPAHMIFSNFKTKYARDLQPGEVLTYWNGTIFKEKKIKEIITYNSPSYWSPLTTEGTLFVDGFLASCYGTYPHELSDLILWPVKMMPSLLLDNEESQHKDGLRSVIDFLKTLGNAVGARNVRKIHKDREIDLAFEKTHQTTALSPLPLPLFSDILFPKTEL